MALTRSSPGAGESGDCHFAGLPWRERRGAFRRREKAAVEGWLSCPEGHGMRKAATGRSPPSGLPRESGNPTIAAFAGRGLRRERRAAAARALHVGVAELEAGAVEALDVVDLGPLQVLVAERIDEELDALVLERLVHVGGLVLEVQVVREASATAADDAEPQALAAEILGAGNLVNLLGRLFCDRDHPTPPVQQLRISRSMGSTRGG